MYDVSASFYCLENPGPERRNAHEPWGDSGVGLNRHMDAIDLGW